MKWVSGSRWKRPYARRNRKLFITTDTLERAIAPEAIIGDSIHPVQ
jgi:hypothetical protein